MDDCKCVVGKYDIRRVGIIHGHPNSLGDSAAVQLLKWSRHDIDAGQWCIACAADTLMTCPADGAGQQPVGGDPVVQEGFAEFVMPNATGAGRNGTMTRNFFHCPFTDACQAVQLRPNWSHAVDPAQNCSKGYAGTLCGSCIESFARVRRGCIDCSQSIGSGWFILGGACVLVAVCAVIARLFQIIKCNTAAAASLVLWISVLQRLWPRLNQSLKIFTSNYQIVSAIALSLGGFPSPFREIAEGIATLVDGAFESASFIACGITGVGGFQRRLLFKVAIPPVLLLLIFIVHKCRIAHLVMRKMPIDDTTEKPWKAKIARTILRSNIWHTTASYQFAVIYLLYPGTTAVILDAFFCRKVSEGGMRVLHADHALTCFDVDGNLTEGYTQLLGMAAAFFLLWAVGVPALFGVMLYRCRSMGAIPSF
jgi:hypothetical protein